VPADGVGWLCSSRATASHACTSTFDSEHAIAFAHADANACSDALTNAPRKEEYSTAAE
jgi:hypothetical protein